MLETLSNSTNENLSDCVFHHAEITPDAPALHHGRATITYAELAQLIAQAATYLSQAGIKPHVHVGIILDNTIDRVVLALAIMRIGAIGIELPADTNTETLGNHIPRFAIAATLTQPGGPASNVRIKLTIGINWRAGIASLPAGSRYAGDPAALTLLNLSSGTTGLLKAYICSHDARLVRSRMTIGANDFYHTNSGPLLLAAPASTNLTWGVLINHLVAGQPVVLLPNYRHTSELVREAATWDNAIFPLPPGLARQMLNHASPDGLLFPRMRALVTAGQAISAAEKRDLIARATPNVYEFYGSGGIGMLTSLSPAEASAQPKSVGRPVPYPGVEVEIASPEGVALPAGAIGQLRVRGPNTAAKFFNPEDNTRGTERFADGWYYPGEIATLNDAGFLLLEGRMADAIKSGDSLIYPQEIEDILLQHKFVAEAAVVGRPTTMPGPQTEDVVAFIVARPGVKHPDIIEHCRKTLTPAQRPRYIYYLEAMPLTGNGKINRVALKSTPLKRIEPI